MAEARILYIATDDGLIQFANPGRSDRWREVGRALEAQPVHAVAAASNDPLLIVAATADVVRRTMDGGFSWEPIWQGEATALAFADDGTLYVGTQDGVLLRQNGDQLAEVKRVDGAIKRLMVSIEQRLVYCTSSHVYAVTSEGVQQVMAFAPDVQLVGVLADPTSQRALVLEEQVGAAAATQQLTGAAVVLGGVDPVLLVGTARALLRSMDGSDPSMHKAKVSDQALSIVLLDAAHEGFDSVPGPQNVSALVTPPRFIDQVFASTKSGELWFSSDRGRTWAALRTDLPPANDLAFVRAR
jgi:ligand-binding sensor domain-containing protein